MKIQTKELTGTALDWAVAKCLGQDEEYVLDPEQFKLLRETSADSPFFYSADWAQGGPIIELEGIILRCGLHGWDAELEEFDAISHGPTALIAAMRCFCCSKLGDVVEVPDELV